MALVVVLTLFAAASAHAASNTTLCRLAKMKAGVSWHDCRCKAEAVFVKSAGATSDESKRDASFAQCDAAIADAYRATESTFGPACPTIGDVGTIIAELAHCTGSGFVSSRLMNTGQKTPFGAGSDGDLQIGTSRSWTDNGDGTVTDNRTGLMWEKKSWDGSIHDLHNTYTWGDGYMDGTVVSDFLGTLNTPPCFAGYCDWRIPNRIELETLANFEVFEPATFPVFDSGCIPGCDILTCSCTGTGTESMFSATYWSSSILRLPPTAPFLPRAWGVNFRYGNDFPNYSSLEADFHARAVRGGF